MIRIPGWLWAAFIVLGLWAVATGAAGLTFQWDCEEYAEEKAMEAYLEGYRPYDSYSFLGLGIGFCTPEYSDD